jgi:hypothetical protein
MKNPHANVRTLIVLRVSESSHGGYIHYSKRFVVVLGALFYLYKSLVACSINIQPRKHLILLHSDVIFYNNHNKY